VCNNWLVQNACYLIGTEVDGGWSPLIRGFDARSLSKSTSVCCHLQMHKKKSKNAKKAIPKCMKINSKTSCVCDNTFVNIFFYLQKMQISFNLFVIFFSSHLFVKLNLFIWNNATILAPYFEQLRHSEQCFCPWYRDKHVNVKHVNKWEP